MICTSLAVMSLCFMIPDVFDQDKAAFTASTEVSTKAVSTKAVSTKGATTKELAPPMRMPAQDEIGSGVTGSLGVDVASQYFFRGIRQEVKGAIVQPFMELNFNVFDGEGSGTLESLDLTLGVVNSRHDGPSVSGGAAGKTLWH